MPSGISTLLQGKRLLPHTVAKLYTDAVNRRITLLGFLIALVIPLQSSAMESATYTLDKGQVNARWEGKGTISMQQMTNGILLTTEGSTGTFLTPDLPKFMAEGITLFVTSEENTPRAIYVDPSRQPLWMDSSHSPRRKHSIALVFNPEQ